MPPESDPWVATLDALEADLESRGALLAGLEAGQPASLPETLPPLPAAHLDRARLLLASLDDQERELAAEQQRVRDELARLARINGSNPPLSVDAMRSGGYEVHA